MLLSYPDVIPWFFILFIAIPLTDFMLLVKLSGAVTIPVTLAVVILTGVVGAALARRQGLRTLAKIQAEMQAGRLPASELGQGMLILVAGVLLMTPGFITDAFGLLLLIPPIRRLALAFFTRHLKSRIVIQGIQSNGRPEWTSGGATAGESEDFSPFDMTSSGPRPRKYVRNEAMDSIDARNPEIEEEK